MLSNGPGQHWRVVDRPRVQVAFIAASTRRADGALADVKALPRSRGWLTSCGCLLVVLVASACGGSSTELVRAAPEASHEVVAAASDAQETPTTDDLSEPSPSLGMSPSNTLEELSCTPAGALCGLGFRLGALTYNVSCAGVDPAALSGDVLGSGDLHEDRVEVMALEGVDVDVAVAISLPGGDCHEFEPAPTFTDWSLAFARGASPDATQYASCTAGALSPAQELADRCYQVSGELAVSCGIGPVFPEWVLTDLDSLPVVGPALGPPVVELLADRPEADRQGWRPVAEVDTGDVFQTLMLRETPDGVEYLLATFSEILAGPAACDTAAA